MRILPLGAHWCQQSQHRFPCTPEESRCLLQMRIPRNCNSAAQPSVGGEAWQHMTILGCFFSCHFLLKWNSMLHELAMHQWITRQFIYTAKVLFILIPSLYVLWWKLHKVSLVHKRISGASVEQLRAPCLDTAADINNFSRRQLTSFPCRHRADASTLSASVKQEIYPITSAWHSPDRIWITDADCR